MTSTFAIYSGSLDSYYGLDRMILIRGTKADVGLYIKSHVKDLFKFFVMIGSCTGYEKNEYLSELEIIIRDVFKIDPEDTPIVDYWLKKLVCVNESEAIKELENRIAKINNEDLVDQFNIGYRGARSSECFFLHIKEVKVSENNGITFIDHVKNINQRLDSFVQEFMLRKNNIMELLYRNFWHNSKQYLPDKNQS